MLDAMPEFMKWFLSIFETVFIAGGAGLVSALGLLSLNYAITSFHSYVWLLPFVPMLVIIVLVLISRVNGWLSHFLQIKFHIKQNVNEDNIEMYYISTILRLRDQKKKDAEKAQSAVDISNQKVK